MMVWHPATGGAVIDGAAITAHVQHDPGVGLRTTAVEQAR